MKKDELNKSEGHSNEKMFYLVICQFIFKQMQIGMSIKLVSDT